MTIQQHTEDVLGSNDSIYIVAIGASAGGLDAIEKIIRSLPADSGIGYVIIQHLDPSRESGLVELIQRWTEMKVVEINDGMFLKANTVYMIPPNVVVAVMNTRFHLLTPNEPHYQWRPIDFFFRSLADEHPERAIGIVLSGAGTDGSIGLKMLKNAGGLTIAQQPDTAAYASMPSNAISTGAVNLILPPNAIAQEILTYVDQAYLLQQDGNVALPDASDFSWQRIFYLLRSYTGHDFSHYKQSTIRRRVERRMLVNRINDLKSYLRYLQHTPVELDLLFDDLLIGVTHFFRDREAFQTLAEKAVRPLIERIDRDDVLRIWINGCSTGEEAYSFAIVVHEQMEVLKLHLKVQIFATDMNVGAITKARHGEYSEGITGDVSANRLDRFFVHNNNKYRIRPIIRDTIIFAKHNTLQDPPFSSLHLISCRNLLIYLDASLQEKLIPMFHYALAPSGYLFLGNSETLGQHSRLFKTIDAAGKLYQRQEVASGIRPSFNFKPAFISNYDRIKKQKGISLNKSSQLRQIAQSALLEYYTPPAMIVNVEGDILYFHEKTGRYLEPATGEANLNILQMAREGLRLLISNMLRRSDKMREEIIEQHVQVKIDDHFEIINLIVRPLLKQNVDNLLLIIFERNSTLQIDGTSEVETSHEDVDTSNNRVLELERELQNTRDHLQSTVEDLETSNEELKSTNEELQSANEELQSTNEELTSAKEELQSVNEELMMVNVELESKIDELSHANDDLHNLLTSVDIGIIFLNDDLTIARFNSAATAFLSIKKEDIHRPISHLASKLEYSSFVDDAQNVLDTLESKELEVRMGPDWYILRIRPYRTGNNFIDGIIITITRITDQKIVQQNLSKLSRAIDQSSSPIVIIDIDAKIDYINQRFFEVTGFTAKQVIQKSFFTFIADGLNKDYPSLHEIALTGQPWQGELLQRKADNDTIWVAATISPISDDDENITHLIVVQEDITQRKLLEQTLQTRWATSRGVETTTRDLAVLIFNRDLQYIFGEGKALIGIGITETDLEGPLSLNTLPSELISYYRSALRGDNSYFERQSGNLWFAVQIMPIRDSNGVIIAGIVVVWDITEQHNDRTKEMD